MSNPDYDKDIANKDEYGNITAKNQDGFTLEENGFYDIPAECEDLECADCSLNLKERELRDCPYLDSV